MLERIPQEEKYWRDNRLTLTQRPYYPTSLIAILSPEDQAKLGTYSWHTGYIEVKDLDLDLVLGNTVFKSAQVKHVCYQCGCNIFYYEKPGKDIDFPKICPLGHPAYEEL
jgi:hypothetical protein